MLNSNMGINPSQWNIEQGLRIVGTAALVGNTVKGLYHEYNSHMNRNFQREKLEFQKQQQRLKSNSMYSQNLFKNNLL